MKFIRFIVAGNEKIGILDRSGKKIIELSEIKEQKIDFMINFIEELNEEKFQIIRDKFNNGEGNIDIEEVKIISPIVRPRHDIICVGVNYRKHLIETQEKFDKNFETPQKTVYFSKRASNIIGMNDFIEGKFELDKQLDYEVELAVIIGKEGKNIPKEKTEDYIFGYSIFNDISSRGLQKDHNQWFRGKSLDTYSAMGPFIVTKDEIKFPVELAISSKVNGEERQSSNTKYFLTKIPELISEISDGITLEAGDIIITGTPEGVGLGFTPPKFLKSHDVVECQIEKIGKLINKIK